MGHNYVYIQIFVQTPRQSGRLRNKAESKTLKKTTVEQTPEPDLGIRRSGRIQHRKQSTAAGSHRNNR